jgi:phospholipid/cholesterol/gamma-HCH transport system substrate-binding protein
MVLNNGGIGQIQEITHELATAFAGREDDLRGLMDQLDEFMAALDDQTTDIISATESLNRLAGQITAQRPVIDKAINTIPDALEVLSNERDRLSDAVIEFGRFSALASDSVDLTKENLVKELKHLGPVLKSLADSGPALTQSLDYFTTFPFPKSTLDKWVRGDYANLTAIIDLTLSRLDSGFLTGTRFEGSLTELEMQWGRTIGQLPSPYTAGNPLIAAYRTDQGR